MCVGYFRRTDECARQYNLVRGGTWLGTVVPSANRAELLAQENGVRRGMFCCMTTFFVLPPFLCSFSGFLVPVDV